MLNRRSLRIKVAQSLYAYNQCQLANFEIALNQISETLSPDLTSMEEQDSELLKNQKQIALEQFKEQFKTNDVPADSGQDPHVVQVVADAKLNFENSQKKDVRFLKKNMVIEAEQVFERYLLILNLLIEFVDLASGKHLKSPDKYANKNFAQNRIIRAVIENNEMQHLIIKHGSNWDNHRQDVIGWYKDTLHKLPEFRDYGEMKSPDFDADLKMVSFVVKTVIFKNDAISTYFESLDLSWEENKTAIKSMVVKSIKSVTQIEKGFKFEVSPLSFNWEDDKAFFEKLFKVSVENDNEFEKLVAEKSKNWDIHRLALMDKIILKMAVCEMINFPSIPVKVTINEYIEISKRYSTPKSKQFVNGLLDGLANKLTAEGVIKKSGRGLIDNK